MSAYYNENDPFAAQWLRNLIGAGHIAPGDVDDRDIRDVKPDDLRGYTQGHFFAGIGIWSHALRQAGWDDDRAVWSGSCPCQPFSNAGKRKGVADDRHLFPVWFDLIRECRPSIIVGEQVASKDGLGWIDLVSTSLEGAGYAIGAADMCAASFGAPHIRQRLYWVSIPDSAIAGGLGIHDGTRRNAGAEGSSPMGYGDSARPDGSACGLGDADGRNPGAERLQRGGQHGLGTEDASVGHGLPDARPVDGFWRAADWLFCRDGRWRAVEPGTFPLAHGHTARVGNLRAYGNAIVAPQASEFIKAVMEVIP